MGSGPPSPIHQVDGEVKALPPNQVLYKCVSDYHKDDIEYTLDELFPAKNAQLVQIKNASWLSIKLMLKMFLGQR